jgi:hypothetical protein
VRSCSNIPYPQCECARKIRTAVPARGVVQDVTGLRPFRRSPNREVIPRRLELMPTRGIGKRAAQNGATDQTELPLGLLGSTRMPASDQAGDLGSVHAEDVSALSAACRRQVFRPEAFGSIAKEEQSTQPFEAYSREGRPADEVPPPTSHELMDARDSERRPGNFMKLWGRLWLRSKWLSANCARPCRRQPPLSLAIVTNWPKKRFAKFARSHLMHPPLLREGGLVSALDSYVKGFAERSKIRVSLRVSENLGRLHEETETTLFRLIQEALINVHRYSGSRTAKIQLVRTEGHVLLEVRDQGRGFLRPVGSCFTEPAGVGLRACTNACMSCKAPLRSRAHLD